MSDPGEIDGEDVPLDDLDADLLDRLERLVAGADPPPADLDDRVVFALAWSTVDADIAALQADGLVAARSDERVRTLTFQSDHVDIMVTATDQSDDRVRVDGWLAPNGEGWQVEVRDGSTTRTVPADERGRFVVAGVLHGLVQLRATRLQAPGTTVVTPAFEL